MSSKSNSHHQKDCCCSKCNSSKKKKASITLTAIPTIITTDEFSTLSGQVLVDGRPAEGVLVVFSLDTPSAGAVIPPVTITDDSGNFTATFVPADQDGLDFVFVTASLPDFPRTTATSVILIG